MSDDSATGKSTAGADYADRLQRLETARWKQVLDVQAPYRRNLQRLTLGRTLDVGCGIGRNLLNLPASSVGVDHNVHAIETARERGLTAYSTDEFMARREEFEGSFEALLAAHLVEHMPFDAAVDVIGSYLPFLKPSARCVFICPQEMGYKTDETHVQFADFDYLRKVAETLGLTVELQYSFPFPRIVGKVFPYNEFVQVARYNPAG